jgi:hypothetical protein
VYKLCAATSLVSLAMMVAAVSWLGCAGSPKPSIHLASSECAWPQSPEDHGNDRGENNHPYLSRQVPTGTVQDGVDHTTSVVAASKI